MPRLAAAPTETKSPTVKFVLSVPLDLMNTMYFTHLAKDHDGVEGLPLEARKTLDRDLLTELDSLYEFPKGQPGLMGQVGDILWAHPEAWRDVASLLRYVREMPLGIGELEANAGVQGHILSVALNAYTDLAERRGPGPDPRATLAAELKEADVDVEAALALYDRPEELRERMARLIERFYEEAYRPGMESRLGCLESSVAAHQGASAGEVEELSRKLTQRPQSCLEKWCAGPYEEYLFAPSLDMGVYSSCAEIRGPSRTIHGLFYPCEAEFIGAPGSGVAEVQRMARVYKALSDEQRLRILHMLREREMYTQELVDRMDVHQSVVSRHLSFLKAVGLVLVRKEGNMKFYSLNPQMSEELSKAVHLFTGA